MDKVPQVRVETTPPPSGNWLIKEIAVASKVTRGSPILWPWLENSAPPFDRMYCPSC